MELYSFFDKLSKKSGDVIFFENDDVAIRGLSNQLINEAKNNILFNPGDFELHKIEGVELRKTDEGFWNVVTVTPSGEKVSEDMVFNSRFIYDFADIDVNKLRSSFESELLKNLENDVEKIKASLARRYNNA